MNKRRVSGSWSQEKSAELYRVNRWGSGYFGINESGEVYISPFGEDGAKVSLVDIADGALDRGLDMPVLLRFENLLDARITSLNEAFANSIKQLNYKSRYQSVYPIKVNQQQQIVREVAKFGQRYHHGFEVGSKPELLAAISEMTDKEACLICNGYKDAEFIDLGLYANKMGYKCFFVVEIPGEVDLILERSKKLGVEPNIGIRIKLSSKAGGYWTDSGGDRSIFGLNMTQTIEVVDQLKAAGKLDTLKLLHYHLGSQIPNIRDIRNAVREASRVYAELAKEGAAMGYIDLGGGLAVDYDGSKMNNAYSRNYTLDEYTTDVVEAVMTIMDAEGIDHPIITTESGRATVAYYSVLLFNVLDVAKYEEHEIPVTLPENMHIQIKNLLEVAQVFSIEKMQECYNDAIYYRDVVRDEFNHGRISLRDRSTADQIFWHIMKLIADNVHHMEYVPTEMEDIENVISDISYCNFSVFQSIPDSWAIDQLFPVMPIQRLNEVPDRNTVIADITCDCDGTIDQFIGVRDLQRTLPMHSISDDEDYYLGVFLVGAYQETLGDLHNLFGDTNIASINIHKNGKFEFVDEIKGDTIEDVLTYVEYDIKAMRSNFRKAAETAVQEGLISPKERRKILNVYENGLQGYTYYES